MSTPVGPYTPIVRAGEWLVVSGQVGISDGKLVTGGLDLLGVNLVGAGDALARSAEPLALAAPGLAWLVGVALDQRGQRRQQRVEGDQHFRVCDRRRKRHDEVGRPTQQAPPGRPRSRRTVGDGDGLA